MDSQFISINGKFVTSQTASFSRVDISSTLFQLCAKISSKDCSVKEKISVKYRSIDNNDMSPFVYSRIFRPAIFKISVELNTVSFYITITKKQIPLLESCYTL